MQSSDRRFAMERCVQLRVGSGARVREAAGRTTELSRRRVTLESEVEAVAGEAVELLVNLGDEVGAGADILFRVRGIVTHADAGRLVVEIRRHRLETRTARAASS